MSILATRRRALQLGSVFGSAVWAGCLGSTTENEPSDSTSTANDGPSDATLTTTSNRDLKGSEWPMFQRDAGNTGTNPTATTVPEEGAVQWQVRGRMSNPAVVDGTVYAATGADQRVLIARDVSTGEKQWKRPIPHGQFGTAPAVADDRIIHQSFGMIHAFDRTQGTELWTYDPGRGAPGAPVVVGDTVYVTKDTYQDDPATATAISIDDGTKRWQVSVRGESAGSPSYGTGSVFFGSSQGFVVALDANDGTERWRFETEGSVTSAVSTAGGVVYATDDAGNLYAVNADDGDEQWRTTVRNDSNLSAPAVGDATLYVGTADGMVAVERGDGSIQWEFSTDGPVGSPTTDERTIYFGGTGPNDHAVHALDAESGQERWSHETDVREEGDHTVVGVFGSPVPIESRLLVVAADGLSVFEPA